MAKSKADAPSFQADQGNFKNLIDPNTLIKDDMSKYVPEGYDEAEDFLRYCRKEYLADANFDKANRELALEDLRFAAGDQWDATVKAEREDLGRPCLTINVLPQFVGQVIGDRRLNETSIMLAPSRDGTAEIANVRMGLIKSIEANSRADRAYDLACEDQVICGISNLRVDLEYAGNDVFDQDIFIRHIPNPLAVVWDRMSVDPTGRDARHCFVTDTMPRDIYDKTWPDQPAPSALQDMNMNDLQSQGWMDKDVVRITEVWELVDKPATFALLQDGKVVDITDGWSQPDEEKLVFIDPKTNKPKIRKSFKTFARMHLITGFAILSKAYEVPVTRLPIIRIEGRVIRVGEDRVRFGLVRFAKDSQRLKNYWRSVAAEALALAPKSQWIAQAKSVDGREDDFRGAHRSGDPLLVFNDNTERPERVDPPQIPAALLNEAQMNQQDIKDTTGLHDASLGIQSNEVSGKAINARKQEGDVATSMYHDNLNWGIQEVGDVVNQFIPICYDTTRTIKVIGMDDQQALLAINDPNDPDAIDITQGKYEAYVDTGPSFTTQRAQAADAMMTIVQTSPEIMAVAGDLVVKAQDWLGAQGIARRLRKTIPPQLLQGEQDPDGDDPTQQQNQQGGPGGDPNDPNSPAGQAQQLQQAQMQNALGELMHAQNMRQFKEATATADAQKAAASAATAHEQIGLTSAQRLEAEAKAHHAHITAGLALPTQLAKLHGAQAKDSLTHAKTLHEMAMSHEKHTDGQAAQLHEHVMKEQQHSHSIDLAQKGEVRQQDSHEHQKKLADTAQSASKSPQKPGGAGKRPRNGRGRQKGKTS